MREQTNLNLIFDRLSINNDYKSGAKLLILRRAVMDPCCLALDFFGFIPLLEHFRRGGPKFVHHCFIADVQGQFEAMTIGVEKVD